jgi:hypothetical protein
MSLENLVRTGQLKRHTPNAAETQRLLAAARRNLHDAGVAHISDETRFDAGYKAIMQCALIGLMATGYRPATSVPGHHQTLIQTLPLTLGVTNDVWLVLDALRKKRNLNDYSGDLLDPESVRECIDRATQLMALVQHWLQSEHPKLLHSGE